MSRKGELFKTAQQATASALAKEGIKVVFDYPQGAGADIVNKTLHIQNIPDDLTEETAMYTRGLVDHETAHIIYTDAGWADGITKKVHLDIVNCIEDDRINELMGRRYFGAGRNIRELYKTHREDPDTKEGLPTLPALNRAMYALTELRTYTLEEQIAHYGEDTREFLELITDEIDDIPMLLNTEDVRKMSERIFATWSKYIDEKEDKDSGGIGEELSEKEDESEGKKEALKKLKEALKDVRSGKDVSGKDKESGETKTLEEMSKEELEALADAISSGEDLEMESVSDGVTIEMPAGSLDDDDGEEPDEDDSGKVKSDLAERIKEDYTDIVGDLGDISKDLERLRREERDKEKSEMDKAEEHEMEDFSAMVTKKMRTSIAVAPDEYSYMSDTRFDITKVTTRQSDATVTLRKARKTVSVLSQRLLSDLFTVSKAWFRRKPKGSLDDRQLFNYRQSDKLFKRKNPKVQLDTAVSLVVDCSGSMYGTEIELARDIALTFSQTLDALNVPHEVVGFTAQGGSDHRLLGRDLTRWGLLEHYVFKGYNDTFRKRKNHINAMPNAGLHQNVDGESVLWAASRLWARKEKRKIMIVISDGAPYSPSTDIGKADTHLKKVAAKIKASGIDVLGIGVQTDSVADYYEDHIVINDLSELVNTAYAKLSALLKKGIHAN